MASKQDILSSAVGSDKNKTLKKTDSDNKIISSSSTSSKKEEVSSAPVVADVLTAQEVKPTKVEGTISFTSKPVSMEDKFDLKRLLKSDDQYFRENYQQVLS